MPFKKKRVVPVEHRKRLSLILKNRYKGHPEKHPAWKGGLGFDENGKYDQNLYNKRKKEALAGREKPTQCEICHLGGKICFDHNHATGKFRGWICHRCNIVIGLAKDEPIVLENIAQYLKVGKIDML